MRSLLFPSVIDGAAIVERTDVGQQFALLVLVNFFVGGMVGIERSILPLVAIDDFGIGSVTAATSFIASFGLAKSVVNLLVGKFSDRRGRRQFLIGGWMVGIPVPFLLLTAGRWEWILFANVLLGVQQGLTWSMTLNMKLDRVERVRHGWAAGWNECAGYSGVALAAFLTGLVAPEIGSRPALFTLGLLVTTLGLILSFRVRETVLPSPGGTARMPMEGFGPFVGVFAGSRSLAIVSASGLLMNLKDGMLWGLLPIMGKSIGLNLSAIGIIAAVYPGVWGIAQLLFGTLSDRVGRRIFVAAGLVAQAGGLIGLMTASTLPEFIISGTIVGIGTAMAYPTLIALITEFSPADRRGSALGVYRFWRDLGYVGGALGVGVVVDTAGHSYAFLIVSLLLILAAISVAVLRIPTKPQPKEEGI